jgi:hypothetical protein
MKSYLRFDAPFAKPVMVTSHKVKLMEVADIRVPLGKYNYIGPVYDLKKPKKQWRIVVDKKGKVYKLETKLNLNRR